MTPVFFGPDSRRLFGVLHRARSGATTAVLLCSPYGPEAIRTHRVYRVLADSLLERGVHVLRFDYYGTGDSAGEDAEGDLTGWTRDILAAHEALVQRTGAQRVAWLGARLGAALAVRASRAVARAPNRLVLWDAVVNGGAYLRDLEKRHAEELAESFGIEHDAAAASRGEALGYALGANLRRELEALTEESCGQPRTVRCDVVERDPGGDMSLVGSRWKSAGVAVEVQGLEHRLDWLRQQALDSALVPAHAVERLATLLGSAE